VNLKLISYLKLRTANFFRTDRP